MLSKVNRVTEILDIFISKSHKKKCFLLSWSSLKKLWSWNFREKIKDYCLLCYNLVYQEYLVSFFFHDFNKTKFLDIWTWPYNEINMCEDKTKINQTKYYISLIWIQYIYFFIIIENYHYFIRNFYWKPWHILKMFLLLEKSQPKRSCKLCSNKNKKKSVYIYENKKRM